MQTATIKVEKIYQPEGKKPGAVKDANGRFWKVWPNKIPLDKFQDGLTYQVGYSTDTYKGQEQYTITSVSLPSNESAASPQSQGQPQQQHSGPTWKDEMIWVEALIKPWMEKIQPGDQVALEHAIRTLRGAFRNSMIKPYAATRVETAPQRQTNDDMNDSIDF